MTKNSQGMPKYPTDCQKDMGRSSVLLLGLDSAAISMMKLLPR